MHPLTLRSYSAACSFNSLTTWIDIDKVRNFTHEFVIVATPFDINELVDSPLAVI